MNGMNFKPFINKVLDTLSDEQVKKLAGLINSHSNNFKNRSLIAGNLTNVDKGVGLYTIQLDENTIRTGYLIYNDTYCVLLGYVSNSEKITEYLITNNTYSVVKEYLTTDYLRHEVQIKAIEKGEIGDIVAKISTTNITGLTKVELDKLEPGDIINKITGNAVHSYHVSYKGDGAGQGICLTYSAAGYIETVSYDRSGDDWVYNSTDISHGYSNINELIVELLSNVAGYDENKVQTLKNGGAGLFAWVDDE